ncbi:MAG TPA: 30S ribosomal protein S11 [Candidatus Zambryskibacteria bacterium]|nr:MAG: Ribosomal protein S11 [Parcubacteria group bacterium GW2011_GWC1_39_12]KKR19665.1 MAG: Ribosomal protein S11 [Parcubacteria group bacterium GW2011_GWF1_39_37]KKR35821.1 MAG: Ribosomal protein S11 [Parcubacteria group bacterium GW2011_GWC2_40_10]KKR52633.1 MAG: Ribosomal protein S11 [Parcubacteria group bacterium GW2011_GWE1_40_20]KKR68896.1 MAG: Ribosomal protein S11 [Parcubacteria group bacterium GW2011_GWF2_40_69]KKR82259.1 MAG: Ribosomal protein S11 [Parcubacteria group bacterium GW
MGKKRIVKTGDDSSAEKKVSTVSSVSKKKVDVGALYVESTYNNTKLVLTDSKGNVLATSSSGSIGFKGAKKGTPFAAAKVGEIIGGKASIMGMRDASVIVKGVGSGRESGIRGFISKGINILSIKDVTPVPHNGPKPKKPRRV